MVGKRNQEKRLLVGVVEKWSLFVFAVTKIVQTAANDPMRTLQSLLRSQNFLRDSVDSKPVPPRIVGPPGDFSVYDFMFILFIMMVRAFS